MRHLVTLLLLASAFVSGCGAQSEHDDRRSHPPDAEKEQIPRWETVDRNEVQFKYYVTSRKTAFQLADEGVGAVAVQPWLHLAGPGGDSMEYVMMFEPLGPDGCKRYTDNKTYSWKGFLFKGYPEHQVAMFEETNRTLPSGKQQSIIHFLVSRSASKCVKLTFYDIELKGYDHKLSVFDKSEMSKTILATVGSVRLK